MYFWLVETDWSAAVMLFVSAVSQSSVFAFFAVVNVVNEFSVLVAAYSSFNEESNLPISAHVLLCAFPRVSAEPTMP